MTKVAIVYHSGYGHTEVLAHKAAQGVADGGAEAVLLKIEGPAQDFEALINAVSGADAVIFGSPTYMGDYSAAFKTFAEASSKVFATGAWRDKLAAGFTVGAQFAGDNVRTLQSLSSLAAQHGMNWINLGLSPSSAPAAERGPDMINRLGAFAGAVAQADNASAEVTPPEGDRETVRLLGERVALAARRWVAGAAQVNRLAA